MRFRAALALGEAYASWAEAETDDDDEVIRRLMGAESWFRDAIRVREDDQDARHNLALAIARRRSLQDQLSAGGRKLEARLDTVLKDQRIVRDELRKAEAAEVSSAAAASSLGPLLEALATRERSIAADVGVISDLAADERGEIEAVPEADRSPEQSGRLSQLAALVHYLDKARTSVGDARRAARREGAVRAVRRAESAVAELIRAREQLLDPGKVIKGLAFDENQLFQQTRVLAALEAGEIALEGDKKPEPPPHLAPDRLAERQRRIHERASELNARLAAFVAHQPDGAESNQAATQAEAKEILGKAAPFVDAAVTSMDSAANALARDPVDLSASATAMADSLTNLARALEYFSGLRQLIEIAYASQAQAVVLLDPAATSQNEMSTEERSRQLIEIGTLGRERLQRLVSLMAREKQRLLAELQKKGAEGDAEAQKQSINGQFAAAETHRAAALARLSPCRRRSRRAKATRSDPRRRPRPSSRSCAASFLADRAPQRSAPKPERDA